MCAPKGAGFLSVREGVRDLLEPTVVSWDWEDAETFADRHRWQGTRDPSPYLAVPAAIDFMDEHDWPSHQARCRALAAQARDELAELFGLEPLPGPIAQMAAARVPPCDPVETNRRLLAEHRVEAPFTELHGDCLIRVSFQAYNDEDDLERLLVGLRALFECGEPKLPTRLLFHLPKERFTLAVRCHRETTSARLPICGRRCGDSTGEIEEVARRHGLTPRQYLLLLMIKGTADGTERSAVSDLVERLQLTQSTVTEARPARRGGRPDRAPSLAGRRTGDRPHALG